MGQRSRNLDKNCMNLKELRQFSVPLKKNSKSVNWGGDRDKLKCLKKNPNFGSYPPPPLQLRSGEYSFPNGEIGESCIFSVFRAGLMTKWV